VIESVSCKDRIGKQLKGRMDDIRAMVRAMEQGRDDDPEVGPFNEYGLAFEYVVSEGHKRGFFRWLLSTGGPGDEFRFFVSPGRHGWAVDRVEYWFLDWWDGAHRALSGRNLELLRTLWGSEFDEFAQDAIDRALR